MEPTPLNTDIKYSAVFNDLPSFFLIESKLTQNSMPTPRMVNHEEGLSFYLMANEAMVDTELFLKGGRRRWQ